MRFAESMADKWAVLDQVLPEYQKLTEAPTSVEELPGYSSDFSAEAFDAFKAKAMAEERLRRYKGMDAHGNILFVDNPWARQIETREDGTCWVVRPRPHFVMSYEEAKRQATRLTVRTCSLSSGSSAQNAAQKMESQVKFEY